MNPHYKAVLADFEQMKIEAEAGIRAIKRLMSRFGEDETEGPEYSDQSGHAATESDESLPTKVTNFLRDNKGKSFRAEQLAEGLGGNVNVKTLRGALSRMVKGKNAKISRAGRGKYRYKASLKSNTASGNQADGEDDAAA